MNAHYITHIHLLSYFRVEHVELIIHYILYHKGKYRKLQQHFRLHV